MTNVIIAICAFGHVLCSAAALFPGLRIDRAGGTWALPKLPWPLRLIAGVGALVFEGAVT